MANQQLPHQCHVARYCEPRYVNGGKILDDAFKIFPDKIDAEAFALKPDEEGLSLCCPEKIDENVKRDEIVKVVPEMCIQLSTQLQLKAEAKLALLNVGDVIKKTKSKKRLKIIHLPEEGYEAHSETRGYSNADNNTIPRIIRKCILTAFSVVLPSELLPPWEYVADTDKDNLMAELRKEIALNHPLHGVKVSSAIAKRCDCDEVLFALKDHSSSYAVVHLTWKGKQETNPTWPRTAFYSNWQDWIDKCVKPAHQQHIA